MNQCFRIQRIVSHSSIASHAPVHGGVEQQVMKIFIHHSSIVTMIQVHYRKDPRGTCRTVCARALHRKIKTNTNPSPDPNRYRRRCPDPNARIQKFIHYMAIAAFAIADLSDSGLSPKQ